MMETGGLIRSLAGRRSARNFHSFVINEIGQSIVGGQFPIGSVLANDGEMMERYGVSRTVLREALKTLEAKGLVEARPKVGTRVSPKTRWNFFDPQVLAWHFHAPADPSLFDSIFRIRAALEPPMVRLAAQHRTAEHVRLLKYWCHQMEAAGDSVEQFGLAVLEVYAAIADAAHDPLLRSIIGVVELTIALALTREQDLPLQDYQNQSARLVGQLILAIEKGDADEAGSLLDKCRVLDQERVH
jgi:DNA-binding FadR family transcriptional regulator